MRAFELYFIGIPVYQSLLFAFFAITRFWASKEKDKLFLAGFMLVNALYFLVSGIYILRVSNYYNSAYYLGVQLFLLIIPDFYIYIRSILEYNFKLTKMGMLHFLPAVIVLILNIPYIFLSAENQLYYIHYAYGRPDMPFVYQYLTWVNKLVISGGIILQMLFYAQRFYSYYPKYQEFILDHYSYKKDVDLSWIKAVAVSFVVFYIILDLYHFLLLPQRFIYRFNFNLLLTGLNLAIGFYGIFKSTKVYFREEITPEEDEIPEKEIPAENNADENPDSDNPAEAENPKPRYRKSALKPEQIRELITQLEIYLSDYEPYKNPLLNIEELAMAINTNTKYLSQAINEHYGMNFFTLINELRINKAISMLTAADHKTFSITGIAQSAGFNSKSAFNAAFKKFTGKTPTEFIAEKEDVKM
jgi:AraC-like DNA-binding protein